MQIHGLVVATEHNSRVGALQHHIPESGRWVVRLEGDIDIRVLPKSLRSIGCEAIAGVADEQVPPAFRALLQARREVLSRLQRAIEPIDLADGFEQSI